MDVLNKLKTTVTQAVSQVSVALPGNPVTREYDAAQHVASAGPGLMWKVYAAVKKSTREPASVFVFEKRMLERWKRHDRDLMLETMKQGVGQLTRLRHPLILTVQHPLEESRESLAFATEPVFASLANVLGDWENVPSPPPPALQEHKLLDVEIKYGLLQLGQCLAFLHNDVGLLHRNLCPESVIVNMAGAWKIAGFDFCVANASSANEPPRWPIPDYCPDVHPLAQPRLSFSCPELAAGESTLHSSNADMYALACLIHAVFSRGGALYNCDADWYAYKKAMTQLRSLPASRLKTVPDALRDTVTLLLNINPQLRPDANQFTQIGYFDDIGVKTLNYLDSLFQWDNLQKSQFYKGLPQILPKLPHRVCLHRILPALAKEFINPAMVPFVLPNTLLVAENASKSEFARHVLPLLVPVMKLLEPIQIPLLLLQRMDLLLLQTPAEAVRQHVAPLLLSCLLPAQPSQLQQLCLEQLPRAVVLLDSTTVKNALLPRLKQLCLNTGQLSTRVGCLVCLGRLLEHLDRWLVIDEVLPLLPQIPSREPAVIMATLGIYRLVLSNEKLGMTKEVMATKVLPFLLPLSIENGLTVAQFNNVMQLLKDLLERVETEHRQKLTQLNAIKDQQQEALNASLSSTGASRTLTTDVGTLSEVDKMFGELGIEPGTSGSSLGSSSLQQNGTSSPRSAALQHTSATSPALTLQDKQRIATQQRREGFSPAMSPMTPGRSAPPPARDLTDTLMGNNLTQIASTQSAPRPPQVPSIMSPSAVYNNSFSSFSPVRQPIPGFVPMGRGGPMQSPYRQPMLPMGGTPLLPNSQQPPKQLSKHEINDFLS